MSSFTISQPRSTHPVGLNKLLPQIVDDLAVQQPEELFGEIPINPISAKDGYRKVTYKDYANAVNGLAGWIERTVGAGKNYETLVYFGPHDMRITLLVLASVKAGYKMIFPSPRFATPGMVELIKRTEGIAILHADVMSSFVAPLLETHPLPNHVVPGLSQLLDQTHPVFPFSKTFEEAQHEPLLVIHTSGSTGFPKPIIWTHGYIDSFGHEMCLDPPDGFEVISTPPHGMRLLSVFPAFHAAHLFTSLCYPLYRGVIAIYPLAIMPPSSSSVLEALRATKVDTISIIPPLVAQLASDPQLLADTAANVSQLIYSGGDIPESIGNIVNANIPTYVIIGATEMGAWPLVRRKGWKADEWHYLQVHPAMNMEMRRQDGDVHEAVIKRNRDTYTQPVFRVFPEKEDYATGDLFAPHPTVDGLWKYFGRTDEMLVFQTGEKFHPVDAEQFLKRHAQIEDALLLGTGLPQAVLLVHVVAGAGVEDIWATVEKMNELCPTYAKVEKRNVILVDKARPILKTGKGTSQRKATMEAYRKDVEKLFKT